LRRLNTEYLDLYYFYLPDWQAPVEESLAASSNYPGLAESAARSVWQKGRDTSARASLSSV
jgi:aryl-alcohol dehydrogenase-like predicted oxidoreductase